MKVYVVMWHDYEDSGIISIYINKAAAEKFIRDNIRELNIQYPGCIGYTITEYEVNVYNNPLKSKSLFIRTSTPVFIKT